MIYKINKETLLEETAEIFANENGTFSVIDHPYDLQAEKLTNFTDNMYRDTQKITGIPTPSNINTIQDSLLKQSDANYNQQRVNDHLATENLYRKYENYDLDKNLSRVQNDTWTNTSNIEKLDKQTAYNSSDIHGQGKAISAQGSALNYANAKSNLGLGLGAAGLGLGMYGLRRRAR